MTGEAVGGIMTWVAGAPDGLLGSIRSRPVRVWHLNIRTCGLLSAAMVTVVGIVLAITGQWWAVNTLGAAVAGCAVTLLCGRQVRCRHRAELARLAQLGDRRAEQVTALSHELRTPLSMIKGAADLLLEQSPGHVTAGQEQFLRVIDEQCSQVIALCEGLLLQAKIEAGLFSLRREQVDIAVLAHEAVRSIRTIPARRDQRISLDTPQVIRSIPADPTLVLQILTNLLSNASRFTSAGGNISVRVMEIDDGVAVYVTDDGAGMTQEQRSRLFQRFATGRPLEDGTGLGLVITKQIVELHGGSILVDTTAQKGTTFLFTLPGKERP